MNLFAACGLCPRVSWMRVKTQLILTVRILHVLDVIAGREHPRGADFIIVYSAQVISGDLVAGDDADQAAWFDRSQLPPLAFRATQMVLPAMPFKSA
jgi:ADP-ribose pyrophosphatase YjhB (NUDIX family)